MKTPTTTPELQHQAWKQRWKEGRTRWDCGQPHPLTEKIIQSAQSYGFLIPDPDKKYRIWEPACGKAHNGALLARMGYQVTGTDISPLAIQYATELYGERPSLSLKVGDIFSCSSEETEAFDAVFDRAALCALNQDERALYVRSCAQHLKPGGLFLSILFTGVVKPEGPPFALSYDEVFELFNSDPTTDFTLVNFEERQDGWIDEVITGEALMIWMKKT